MVTVEAPVAAELSAVNVSVAVVALVWLNVALTPLGKPDAAKVTLPWKPFCGFTTIELKSNHLGTAREGTIECTAKPVHLGKTTQVWDSVVTHRETGKTIALFRCTQMVLYGK